MTAIISMMVRYIAWLLSDDAYANVFTAATDGELLKAVSFAAEQIKDGDTSSSAVSGLDYTYNINVYTGLTDAGKPESGNPAQTLTGTKSNPGYYTLQLDEPVALTKDELFSVVVSFTGHRAIVFTHRQSHHFVVTL